MDDGSVSIKMAEPEDAKASIINGLAGVAAAVVAEEALSHARLGGAAGLVAASVGGLVVYGLDHSEFGKTIEQEFFSPAHSEAIMPNCLPQTDIIHDAIELVARPFEPLVELDSEFSELESPPLVNTSELPSENIDNIIGGEAVYLPPDASPAQSIIDHLTHSGMTICDPPQSTDIDVSSIGAAHYHGSPSDLV